MSTQRLLNAASVNAIMKQRTALTEKQIGKKVVFTIQGGATKIFVTDKNGAPVESMAEPGTVLERMIYNLQTTSAVAMKNPRNLELLRAGLDAEKAGDAQTAHENFNKFLNAVQVSFGILLPSKIVDKLSNGVDISAKVELITTENGSLLTIDPKTISIQEPEVIGKTTFDMDALLGTATPTVDSIVKPEELDEDDDDEDEDETEEQRKARIKAEKKAAKLAAAAAGGAPITA